MRISLAGHQAILTPTGGIYFESKKTFLLSDLHIGKASHFRKHGVPISKMVDTNNLWNLSGDLARLKPAHVIFLGDLFHSDLNQACHDFGDFLQNFPDISWTLVEGNHDILHPQFYTKIGINVVAEGYLWNELVLRHEPDIASETFNLAGHIHPGIRLKGKGKQSLRLACFYEHKTGLILPAYGDFTGKHVVKPKSGERVYAIADNELIAL